jgi:hypothetical protein
LSLDPNKSEIISARPIKRCLELLLGRVALYQKVYKASETIELPEAQRPRNARNPKSCPKWVSLIFIFILFFIFL